jgi:peroxiredoxin-like protein
MPADSTAEVGAKNTELRFDVALRWSGTGRRGAGEILTENGSYELSGPESMGGRGVGTNPEQLLVAAVSSCYTATLFAVLVAHGLAVDSLAVAARGHVVGYPHKTRFASIAVNPTILGGEPGRQSEYEAAAVLAHDRCFIGGTLAPDVAYEVGSVAVQAGVSLRPAGENGEVPLPWRGA